MGARQQEKAPGPAGPPPFAKGKNPPALRATPFCERGLWEKPAGQPLFLLKQKQEPPAGGWLLFPHFTSERMSKFFIKYSTPE